MHTTQLELEQYRNITRPSSSLFLSERRKVPVGMTMVKRTSAIASKAMVIIPWPYDLSLLEEASETTRIVQDVPLVNTSSSERNYMINYDDSEPSGNHVNPRRLKKTREQNKDRMRRKSAVSGSTNNSPQRSSDAIIRINGNYHLSIDEAKLEEWKENLPANFE